MNQEPITCVGCGCKLFLERMDDCPICEIEYALGTVVRDANEMVDYE